MSTTPIVRPVPFLDLKAQYATIADEVHAAMQECVERGDFVLGQALREFEEKFARFCGTEHCVGVGNGTEALHLACRAAGIGPGDEVIVPAFTFIATALGVIEAGGTPVLVDVRSEDGLIDPDRIEAAITEHTKAIIPVHMFGQCADMKAILKVARAYDLVVIEDAAQAHGARDHGIRAGAHGDFGCFSFYPGKNLGAYGDGGAIVTNTPENARALLELRNLGSIEKYVHESIGFNSRLDTIQAAILSVKLDRLDRWNAARREIAARYDAAFADVTGLKVLRHHEGREHVHHLYVIECEQRDRVLADLQEAGIGAGLHYPKAIHQHAALEGYGWTAGGFPEAEHFAAHCLTLPIYAEMDDEQVESVISEVTRIVTEI